MMIIENKIEIDLASLSKTLVQSKSKLMNASYVINNFFRLMVTVNFDLS